ncbi:MAG: hypothetical protein E7310_01915 [Clostridiales bacterium]|nr:hypothetical protein [Clostridiales bacterium]
MLREKNYLNKIQLILFTCFLFLWYISANQTSLRTIAICIFGIFCIIEVVKIFSNKKIMFNSALLSFIFLVAFGFISLLWAKDDSAVISKAIALFMGFVFLTLSYNFFMKIENPTDVIIKIIKLVGVIFSIYVILYYGIMHYFNMLLSGRRIGTEIINVNFIGVISSITFILLIYDLLLKNTQNKIGIILFSIIPLIVSLGTGSKKVIIVIVLGLIILLLKKFKEKFTLRNIITIFMFLAVIIISISFFYNRGYLNTIFGRFETMINTLLNEEINSGSTYVRKMFIKSGLEAFLRSPLFGIGLNNSRIITYELFEEETYLHCNYVELLACMGIIGFTLFYYIYYYVIYNCIKNKNTKNSDIIMIIFIINLFLDIGNVSYYEIKTFMYFLLGIVFVGTIKKEKKKNEIKR